MEESGRGIVDMTEAARKMEIISLINSILEQDTLSFNLLERFQECRYLILLDMGCGNASAAVFDLGGYRKAEGNAPDPYIYPVPMDYGAPSSDGSELISVGQPSIPVIVGFGLDEHGCPVADIGPEALKWEHCCENFKTCPNDQNLNRVVCGAPRWDLTVEDKRLRDVWRVFLEKFLDRICAWADERLETLEKIRLGTNTLVMVAHPAGLEWAQPVVLKNYRDLAARPDLFPAKRVLTISEAKACMQYVRRRYGKELDFRKGVLVLDIGASTMDVEFLAFGEPDPVEFSIMVGGREADRLLAHYILEQVYPEEMKSWPGKDQIPDDAFFAGKHVSRAGFLYQARVMKETLSSRETDPTLADRPLTYTFEGRSVPVSAYLLRGLLGDPTNDPLKGIVSGDVRIRAAYELPMALSIQTDSQPRGVQQVKATWYGHLEHIAGYSMRTLKVKGRRPSRILVTGGSCMLTGIRDHIRKAVNEVWPEFSGADIVYMDQEADCERAVPFGGAYYVGGILRHMDRLLAFPGQLQRTLWNELLDLATDRLCEAISRIIFVAGQHALKWWAQLPNLDSLCGVPLLFDQLLRDYTIEALQEKYLDNYTSIISNESFLQATVDMALKSIREEELVQTKALIDGLLRDLATKGFQREVSLGGIRITLPLEALQSAVVILDPATMVHGFAGGMQKLWNSFLNLFRLGSSEGKIRRVANFRIKAFLSYTEPPTVTDAMRQNIRTVLEQEARATDLFGIPDQIILGLKESICEALYLST